MWKYVGGSSDAKEHPDASAQSLEIKRSRDSQLQNIPVS